MRRPYKPVSVSPAEWLFTRVDTRPEPEACWIWPGSQNGDGYGKLSVNGKIVSAHRFAYEVCVGPIPDGLTIDHLCVNRLCIRPSHLEVVTRTENLKRGYERRGFTVKRDEVAA